MKVLVLICLLFSVAAIAQPTAEQYQGILDLVQSGEVEKAKIKVETYLEIFPGDKQLQQMAEVLKSVEATDSSQVVEAVAEPAAPKIEMQTLSHDDRLEIDTVVQMAQEIAAMQTESVKLDSATKVLERQVPDQAAVSGHPDWIRFWAARASCALIVDDLYAGVTASIQLKRLGLLESENEFLRSLMVALNRKGWLDMGKVGLECYELETALSGGDLEALGAAMARQLDLDSSSAEYIVYWQTRLKVALQEKEDAWGWEAAQALKKAPPTESAKAALAEADAKCWLVENFSDIEAARIAAIDRLSFQHWFDTIEEVSSKIGDTSGDHAFRVGQTSLIYAHAGSFSEANERIDMLYKTGDVSEDTHSYFLQQIAFEMVEAKKLDEAMQQAQRLSNYWHRRELLRLIAENCLEAGRYDLGKPAIDQAYVAQEAFVRQEGGEFLEPFDRCSKFTQLAHSALAAGLSSESIQYIQKAENFAERVAADRQVWAWLWVGNFYATKGDIQSTESALTRMTSGTSTTASIAALGWTQAAKTMKKEGNSAGAQQLLKTGRKVLNRAGRSYSSITKDFVKKELDDSVLDSDVINEAIEAKQPDQAFAAYQSEGKMLRYATDTFHDILNLYLELGNLQGAERMLVNPKLGVVGNAEDISETESTLAFAYGKIAGAIFAKQGEEAYLKYVAALTKTSFSDFYAAREAAYALARANQLR